MGTIIDVSHRNIATDQEWWGSCAEKEEIQLKITKKEHFVEAGGSSVLAAA